MKAQTECRLKDWLIVCTWLKNYFGEHHYGFRSGSGPVFTINGFCFAKSHYTIRKNKLSLLNLVVKGSLKLNFSLALHTFFRHFCVCFLLRLELLQNHFTAWTECSAYSLERETNSRTIERVKWEKIYKCGVRLANGEGATAGGMRVWSVCRGASSLSRRLARKRERDARLRSARLETGAARLKGRWITKIKIT